MFVGEPGTASVLWTRLNYSPSAEAEAVDHNFINVQEYAAQHVICTTFVARILQPSIHTHQIMNLLLCKRALLLGENKKKTALSYSIVIC